MDIKAIAEQVMGALGEAPEKIHELIADPKGVIEQITGHTLEEGQIGEVVEHIKTQISEGAANFDLSAIGDQLGGLFGEGSPLGGIGDALGDLFGKK
ncbi:MAG: hypothetical protein RRZ85_09395 [Gordonibacter sp.]|uniref:hypothetical protein n=1 Tax=Gordonibacter sp. TaxID=1968902 RepID=UPI002FCC37F9